MALQSMTGFARTNATLSPYSWTWEVRSVNAKGLDVRLRLPHGFEALDVEVRSRIASCFKRGNISISLNLQKQENAGGVRVNKAVLQEMLSAMNDIKQAVEDVRPASLDGIMALKGVIEPVEEGDDEDLRAELHLQMLENLTEAVDSLKEHRLEEGGRLETVLKNQIDEIENLNTRARELASSQPQALRARLVRQLEDVMNDLPELDPERISQEAALLMTKADICEELDRLDAHVEGARALLSKGSPCGRKLDFLCQEFNREANTLCSKAQDVELTRIGLDFKAVIDQFREQVQNIE